MKTFSDVSVWPEHIRLDRKKMSHGWMNTEDIETVN